MLGRLGVAAAVALLLPLFGSHASAETSAFSTSVALNTTTPPGALAGCGGEAYIGQAPVWCDTSFTLTGNRHVKLVMHPDLDFVGDLAACLYSLGDEFCRHYLRATFVAGQPVGLVDEGNAAGLLEAGTWHMWLAAGSNIGDWQIPRICPLGPVFDPYCWYGVGGFDTPGLGGSANGRFAGSAVGL